MYKNNIEIKRNFFKTGITRNINFRIKMLKNLKQNIIKYEKDITLAIKKDLSRSKDTTYMAEILPVLQEIDYFIKNIKNLTKIKSKKTSKIYIGYKSYEIKEPYGVCLIISPWNYPFLLAISPFIGAIASGNCVIVKPSEYSVNTSNILKKIIDKTFDKKYCEVLLGNKDIAENLIDNHVDFIFFTGGTNIGKVIMERASKSLTPIALELGGKSPCIVDRNINIDKTAKRIVWGKTLNAGQTCISPDYLLVHKDVKEALIQKIIFYTKKIWGKEPLNNKDYPKIINENNFNRVLNLLKDTRIIYGGKCDNKSLKIEPTYIEEPSFEHIIMKEEIFAPIMPILVYENIEDIYNLVEKNKNPLAMYIFSTRKTFVNTLIKNIPCGNICINDTILQVTNHNIPFGGRGYSGMGVYHGKYSYNLFSHRKGVLNASNIYDINIRYKQNVNLNLIKVLLGY